MMKGQGCSASQPTLEGDFREGVAVGRAVPSARSVALIGVAAALSFVLAEVGWTPQPNGGRISLGDIPILIVALGHGWRVGVAAGAVAGILHFPQQPVTAHPLSILLDYPLACACIGLAGLASSSRLGTVAGVTAAVGLKYVMHVVSGFLFWSQGLTWAVAWSFSAGYNAAYMVPMLGIDLLIVVPLTRRLSVLRGASMRREAAVR